MVVIVNCTFGTGVGMMVANGLKVGYGIREDAYLVVRSERCEHHMHGDQFCPHDGAGFFRPRGIYIDGSAGGNVYHRRP